ncbi:MAG: DUF2384 domain-containing protein [Tatlockia sp.]|nr:DUF2384 domain-containing protein [Tatlockia sp.]
MISAQLLKNLKDPIKEIKTIREGILTELIEDFLKEQSIPIKDILQSLQIPKSTYFSKKRSHTRLDSSSTEKFLRLISVMKMSEEILGKNQSKEWLYKKIPSLGEQIPMDLLDTEAGHRLVEQVLLQIKYGIYS